MLSKTIKAIRKYTQIKDSLSYLIHLSIVQFSIKKSHEQLNYYEKRIKKLQKIQPSKINSKIQYPHFSPTISIPDFIHIYQSLKQNNSKGQKIEKVSGRISSIRFHGKTIFIDIRQQHIKLQLALKTLKKSAQDQLQFHRGDIIGVQGIPFVTKKGQLSLQIESQKGIKILSPCLWMLPQYKTLKDNQVRYRQKYLDLITNQQPMRILKTRSKIISSLRKNLQRQGYIQVQTPVLSPSCGGAVAKPFSTFHNDHKMNLFMRIAPQLYLKKLLIGGLSKVFQIGKNFRNQSIDQTHNPQFTTCQLYCAYSDYQQMMKFTKQLLITILFEVTGKKQIVAKSIKEGDIKTQTINLNQQWRIFDFIPDLQKYGNFKLPNQFQSQEARKILDGICGEHHVHCQQPRSASRLLDKLAGKYLEQQTIEPFFIINHPRVMSPLAKPHDDNPNIVQRFQLFINGWQIVNSYTQLNDPNLQKQNTPGDSEFVQALEYGLMPCAGWGIGLDRLVMLVTGSERIQQVIAFPLLKQSIVGNVN